MNDTTISLVQSLPVGVDLGLVLLRLARIYETDRAALAQLVENGRDGGAQNIWIELRSDPREPQASCITVTDNGCGLGGWMKEAARDALKNWLVGNRELSWEQLLAQMTPSSRQSFELMMSSVARSTKAGDRTMLGEMHLGSLAHYQFADQTVYYSIPNGDLQMDAGIHLKEGEVFLLRFPTTAQLEANQVNFGLAGPLVKPLKDPWGKRLQHGTQVVIRQLHPGFEHTLAPGLLAEHLSNCFGEDIRQQGLEIVIFDRMTEEGRNKRGGRVIIVKPPEYRGTCLLDRVLTTVHGKHQFHAQLFYKPGGGTNLSPKIFRKTSGGRPLKDLPEEFLHQSPWNQLEGIVEAPEGLEWSSNKDKPLQSSRTYRHWMACLRSLTDELEDLIAAADKRSRERKATRFSAEVVDAVLEAMAGNRIFGDQSIGTLPKISHKKKSQRQKKEEQIRKRRIEATVVDQYDQAFEGAVIELWSGGKLIDQRTTGRSGYVAFCNLALNRKYKVKFASVPADCLVEGTTEIEKPLTPSKPGFRFLFHARVNRPPKEKPEEAAKLDRMFRPQLWIRDIPDADPEKVMYRGRLPGLIEIHSANGFVAAALGNDDRAELDQLVSYCCAAAVAEYLLKGQTLEFVLQAIGQLAAGIYENLEESRKKKGKKKTV